MRRHGRAPAAVLALGLVLLAGCVTYPMVTDVGGVRIQPTNGRIVRDGASAVFVAEINSTGKFDDTIMRVETSIARKAQLVDAAGAPLEKLKVPGATLLRLAKDGPRVLLSELTRELKPGEVVIVTLFFEKAGAVGVISPVD
jgi:copper(I)-binding protein